jgi:hypothetical protein
MSITACELWTHAASLKQGTEAEIRTKISRAYYALFSHACEFNSQLPSEGNLLRNDVGAHHQLGQKLTNPTVDDPGMQARSRELGTKQKMAHELRVRADYELDAPVGQADLLKCLRYVRQGMEIHVGVAEEPRSIGGGTTGGKATLTRIS